jgi:hypothetical protein
MDSRLNTRVTPIRNSEAADFANFSRNYSRNISCASALEDRFSHVARELVARWKSDLIDPYMDSLLIDTRGGRQGFPPDAQEELMLLSGVLWHRQHIDSRVENEQKPESFSFSAVNESDMRRCGTTGAWVLI